MSNTQIASEFGPALPPYRWLKDVPCPSKPVTITPEQECQITALACEAPV